MSGYKIKLDDILAYFNQAGKRVGNGNCNNFSRSCIVNGATFTDTKYRATQNIGWKLNNTQGRILKMQKNIASNLV